MHTSALRDYRRSLMSWPTLFLTAVVLALASCLPAMVHAQAGVALTAVGPDTVRISAEFLVARGTAAQTSGRVCTDRLVKSRWVSPLCVRFAVPAYVESQPAPVPPPLPAPPATSGAPASVLALIGPRLTVSEMRADGAPYATFADRWIEFGDYHWARGGTWGTNNYYDRAYNHYVLWVLTGDAKWRDRATALALDYRTNYLEANAYGSSPHWAQLEGLYIHWRLTGDVQSKRAVVETAKRLSDGFTPANSANPSYQYNEGRIQARVALAALLAHLTGDTSRDWGGMTDAYVRGWIGYQKADGSFSYRLETENAASPMGQSNFMEGMRANFLIKYLALRPGVQDAAVRAMLVRMADYMLTQYNPASGTFKYYSVHGPADPSLADLNHMIVELLGYAYSITRVAQYKAIGDAAFDAGVPPFLAAYTDLGRGEFLDQGKQYNEHHYSAYRYVALRR